MHQYGWRPSYPDFRNYVADVSTLPDPKPDQELAVGDDIPLFDQGQLGSCTANAANRAARHWSIQARESDPGDLSRLETYYGERKIEGSLGQGDTGAFGHDAFKWLSKHGAAPESEWPYIISRFEEKPPDSVMTSTNRLTIGKYVHPSRVSLLQDIARMLFHGQMIIFGFSVYESFESEEVTNTGVVPMPHTSESMVGGHEVVISGFDPHKPDYFRCDNSWGDSWGDNGRFWMPKQYLANPDLATDFRTIVIPQ